jgi:hypothetical protein
VSNIAQLSFRPARRIELTQHVKTQNAIGNLQGPGGHLGIAC